jgi:hypothetical protein
MGRGLDPQASGKFGPRQRAGHDQAGRGIRGAADDHEFLARACVHATDPQLVGVGVLVGAQDAGDHDAAEGRRDGLDRLDLEAAHGQGLGERLAGERRVAVVAQPLLGKLHLVTRAGVS